MDKSTMKVEELSAKEQITNVLTSRKFVTYSSIYKNCCVGWVDIVDSTKITSRLSKSKVSPFYCLFLNQMSSIIGESGGTVVKNVGDSLLFYFPETSNNLDRANAVAAIECGLKMIDYHQILNSLMLQIGLPNVNYRVSLDYGEVMLMKPESSTNDDIFGSTVNFCAKMNKMTAPNTLIIGGDVYQIAKSSEGYRFELLCEYHNGLKQNYPLYSVKCI